MKATYFCGPNFFVLLVTFVFNLECKAADYQFDDNPANCPYAKEDRLRLPPDSTDAVYSDLKSPFSVFAFYKRRSYQPMWNDGRVLNSLGDSLLVVLEKLRYYGLLPKNYHFHDISKELIDPTQDDNLLRVDALMSDAFLAIASDLRNGILPARRAHSDIDQIVLLERVGKGLGLLAALQSQEPVMKEYWNLKQALKLELDSLDGDERAIVMGGYELMSDANRNIQKIEINLERWRWERNSFGDRYILVNIPSFMFHLFDGGKEILTSRVIVGTTENPTPTLSSAIECFVVYPYWHVPRKIAVEEYLPMLKKDLKFLSRNNFEVLGPGGIALDPETVDWAKFTKDYFPVSLRQKEGPENSLGVIKFEFDNPYAVFLHDTNAKRLFNRGVRAYSHGCIRMEKALTLAHYLATGQVDGHSQAVDRYLKEKQRHTIEAFAPVPINIRYFTAEFINGDLRSYPDLYSKDDALINLCYQ